MLYVITYASGVSSQLSKIISEINISNFAYMSTGQCIYVSKGVEDPLLFFGSEKESATRKFGRKLLHAVEGCIL